MNQAEMPPVDDNGHQAEWIASEWSEDKLQFWAMRDGQVLAQRRLDLTHAPESREAFATTLNTALAGWPEHAALLISGRLPAALFGTERGVGTVPLAAQPVLSRLAGMGARPVWATCPVRQSDPVDLLEGAQPRIAGLLVARPDFDGVACLPGRQSQWVRISAGEICHFSSFMTGALSDILAPPFVPARAPSDTMRVAVDLNSMARTAEEALSQPHRAYAGLAPLQAAVALGEMTPDAARDRLSGLLIGWELAGAKPYWLGQEVALIGQADAMALYARALADQGAQVTQYDATSATLAGLGAAWAGLAR